MKKIVFVLVVLAGLALALPETVHAQTLVCDTTTVNLEIAIGGDTSVQGLSGYIVVIYQFIVGVIGVLSAIMIMYAGVQWAAAGGNSDKIGDAKQRLINAIVGLVIALTSYVLLFAINPALVQNEEPCLPDAMIPSSISGEWETCTGTTASCAEVDYCKINGANCSCDSVGGEKYCRPNGTNVMPQGEVCKNQANCKEPFTCSGPTSTAPGVCTYGQDGDACTDDDNCRTSDGFECQDTPNGSMCLQEDNRTVGAYCDDPEQCITNACSTELGNECLYGDGRDEDPCINDNYCTYGYKCVGEAFVSEGECVPVQEGDSCDSQDKECGAGLYCVEDDGAPGFATCYDGSHGDNGEDPDPCDGNDECQSGSCVYGFCAAPGSGSYCDDNSDCQPGFFCVDNDGDLNDSSCHDGSIGSPCDENSECDSGHCNDDDICSAGTTGDNCEDDDDCGNGYFCVANDGDAFDGTCYPGEIGNPCDSDLECQSGHCNDDDVCSAGLEDDNCEDQDDCEPGYFCVFNDGDAFDGTCYDGSIGDPCDGNNECVSGHCGENQCTDGSQGSDCDVPDGDADCADGLTCEDGFGFDNTCQPK